MSQQIQQPMAGASIDFAPDTLIFREGDTGGDLFLIKEGEVEVFRETPGSDVRLAVLKAGEILGIMTCLTREPRLASARAMTHVKALIVKQAGIRSLISSTPAWVHTVIKDFTLRVKDIDELYMHVWQRLQVRDLEASDVRLAVQVANGLMELGEAFAAVEGDDRIVDGRGLLDRLARILDVSPDRTERIFGIFAASGLLGPNVDAECRRVSLGVLERVGSFADVARRYLRSLDVRVAYDQLSDRDRTYLSAVFESLEESRQQLFQECTLPLSRLVVGGVAAEMAVEILGRAAAAGLVRLESSANETLVTLVPSHVSSTLQALLIIDRLRQEDPESSSNSKLSGHTLVAALA